MKGQGLALLCAAPCRPLFPLALLCGLAVVGRVVLDPGYAPVGLPATGGLSWHGQEMLFGFVAGGFVGYLLTALPSWAPDQRLPPRSTLMLVLAWLLARLATWGGLGPDPLLCGAAALGFPLLTTLLLLRAAWHAPSPRGTLALGFALLLLAAQVAALAQQLTADLLPLGLALLLSVMAGRMLAAFTWARLPGRPPQAARLHLGNRLALLSQIALGGALALALIAPGREVAQGLLLALAAVAEAARWILWQARPIWRDPGLTQLHLAYVWLPLALWLLAQHRLGLALPGLDGLDGRHALTVGAVSCMIHAVMARSVAWRGASLRPQPDLRLGFALVWMAALARVGLYPDPGHTIAALLWAAGWGLLLRRLIQHLHRPLPHPVFSQRRPPDAPEPRRLFPNPRSLAIPEADPAPPRRPS